MHARRHFRAADFLATLAWRLLPPLAGLNGTCFHCWPAAAEHRGDQWGAPDVKYALVLFHRLAALGAILKEKKRLHLDKPQHLPVADHLRVIQRRHTLDIHSINSDAVRAEQNLNQPDIVHRVPVEKSTLAWCERAGMLCHVACGRTLRTAYLVSS